MNETTYSEQHYDLLRFIPVFSGSARVVDLLMAFDAITVSTLTEMLNLLVADGLVERIAQKEGATYRLTPFGKLIAGSYQDADARWAFTWIGSHGYDIVIYAVPHAIQAPFVCWRVRSGEFITEGGALNERLAWIDIKIVLEQQTVQVKGVTA